MKRQHNSTHVKSKVACVQCLSLQLVGACACTLSASSSQLRLVVLGAAVGAYALTTNEQQLATREKIEHDVKLVVSLNHLPTIGCGHSH